MRTSLIGAGVVPRYHLTASKDDAIMLHLAEGRHRPAGAEARS